MDSSVKPIDEVVEEIMRIHRSLTARPGIDEIEAAKTLIQNVEKEDQARIEAISRQRKVPEVPEELFMVLQEMQKNLVYFQSKEQKKEAMTLLDLENAHEVFDELIQRASRCVPSSNSHQPSFSMASTSSTNSSGLSLTNSASFSGGSLNSPATATSSTSSLYYDKHLAKPSELYSRDDTFVKKVKATFHVDGIRGSLRSGDLSTPQILDSSLKSTSISGQDGEKLSLIRLASLIEVYSKKGTRDLNLQNKLMDQVDWLPDSIGKLSSLITLDLSENRIMALPATIGGLSSLTKLDLHSNGIDELPDSIGDLLSLVCLDLSANQLTYLPATFGRLVRLEELDLSSNHLPMLPESIGSLISLKKLIVETNNIEEIPHSIGQCSSLRELRADYNRLKALPEAVGRIASLKILSVRYNNVRQLPTTMSSLSNLRELNVSFNELESLPESLCFASTIVKINVSNNFADLQFLPRSIGNLELLEELDISNNQIRILPDSFRSLLRLRVLNVEGNPLEEPPRSIADMGAQAVVQYMAEIVAKRDAKTQMVKQKKSWAQICFFSKSNKRKRDGMDYVKA
ncbi:Plant intracellular Ras-group-related LRR protein [Actinidia chinensis var. chinensis]|uniref:Plant intracellular Ras-group-related LRR protein n=1 Tax=Actinidia chinensis var. chinensis TaxID=1590841 RepID=A0A2R6RJA8_ACTCC|nr:Plant intracellular Ras-group-related LRR protein [Actinidia chinensis var. chinensis]